MAYLIGDPKSRNPMMRNRMNCTPNPPTGPTHPGPENAGRFEYAPKKSQSAMKSQYQTAADMVSLLSEWEQRAARCRPSGRAELDRENDLGTALLPRRGR